MALLNHEVKMDIKKKILESYNICDDITLLIIQFLPDWKTEKQLIKIFKDKNRKFMSIEFVIYTHEDYRAYQKGIELFMNRYMHGTEIEFVIDPGLSYNMKYYDFVKDSIIEFPSDLF